MPAHVVIDIQLTPIMTLRILWNVYIYNKRQSTNGMRNKQQANNRLIKYIHFFLLADYRISFIRFYGLRSLYLVDYLHNWFYWLHVDS